MFIDAAQVSSFYDAVIGPEFRTVQLGSVNSKPSLNVLAV
jgi:hypothetical protein